MKFIISLFLLCIFTTVNAQSQLQPADFNRLISLSELYSVHGGLAKSDIASANKLRSSVLNPVIDVLISSARGDSTILQKSYQAKPQHSELMLWYVIDQINENRHNDKAEKKPAADIAETVLAQTIDDKILLDSYYSFQSNGFGLYFNTADLSHYNFDLENMGFQNEAEKAVFYFKMMQNLTYGRFRVLNYMKKQQKLVEVASRLPLFNGKKYYEYASFNYDDFASDASDGEKTFNAANFNRLYETLLLHFNALATLGNKEAARTLYFNSILHTPKYFNYSELKDTLNAFYSQSN